MAETFAGSARRLAGLASYFCGWTPDVFWNATPEELATIFEVLRGDGAEPPDATALARLKEAFPDG